jgi:hypothetical protein
MRESAELDPDGDSPAVESVAELSPALARYFMEVPLSGAEIEAFTEEDFLAWGCYHAPSPLIVEPALEQRLTSLTTTHERVLESASEDQRGAVERLQQQFIASCGDLIEEVTELTKLGLADNNQPRNVRVFESAAELAAVDPERGGEQWGYTLGWSHQGRYALLRYDTADDALLSSHFETIDRFRAIRDQDVERVLGGP